VKRRFLHAPPDIEIVFLLTYTIARLKKLVEMPEHATNNPFAGQLQINLLFDLTLVIDNSIKSRSRRGTSFIDAPQTRCGLVYDFQNVDSNPSLRFSRLEFLPQISIEDWTSSAVSPAIALPIRRRELAVYHVP
jgi:hypothetical protein